VLDRAGARDRQHHGGAAQQPGQRELGVRRVVVLGDLVEQATGLGQVTRGDREPRDEADALALAVVEDVLDCRLPTL
jgi:hypothetical protein